MLNLKILYIYIYIYIGIISKQVDIKLGPFTQEERDSVLRKIKNRKAKRLVKIPPEVWRTRQFDDILFRHCNAVYNQNPKTKKRSRSYPAKIITDADYDDNIAIPAIHQTKPKHYCIVWNKPPEAIGLHVNAHKT